MKDIPDQLKVLIPLSCIEDDSVVTKKTGTKQYTVKRAIEVYAKAPEQRQTITASLGAVFLVADDGNINAEPETTEVLWLVGAEDLWEDLNSCFNESY